MPSDQPDLGSALKVKRLYEAACRRVGQLKPTRRNVLRLANTKLAKANKLNTGSAIVARQLCPRCVLTS